VEALVERAKRLDYYIQTHSDGLRNRSILTVVFLDLDFPGDLKRAEKVYQRLVNISADLLNPESVKEVIARKEWSVNTKIIFVNTYTAFLRSIGKTWEPPSTRKCVSFPSFQPRLK